MTDWLAVHPAAATVAAWYYVVVQGAVTAIVGLLLLIWRVPAFRLPALTRPPHREPRCLGQIAADGEPDRHGGKAPLERGRDHAAAGGDDHAARA